MVQTSPTIGSSTTVAVDIDQRANAIIRNIKAHIAKGDNARERADQNHKRAENHFVSAGQYLGILKEDYTNSWEEWLTLLKTKVGISSSRAQELIQIGSGTKTVEQVRADTNARKIKHRAALRSTPAWNGEESTERADLNDEQPNRRQGITHLIEDERGVLKRVSRAAFEARGAKLQTEYEAENELIGALASSTPALREAVVEKVVTGSKQSDFEAVRDAVADLYTQLMKAGR